MDKNIALKNTKKTRYYLIPFILVLAVIPLIVRYCEYDSRLGGTLWFDTDITNDFFLYWKSLLFIILSGVMTCMLFIRIYRCRRTMPRSAAFLFLWAYAILAFLSALLSRHSYFSFMGIFEDFESVWVLLGYCVTAAFAFYFIADEKDVKITLRFLFLGAGLLSMIGVFQAFSMDFYQSRIGKLSFLPPDYWYLADKLVFHGGIGQVYSSLLNPNYVGVYVSLLLPLPLVFLLFGKNAKNRLASFLLLAFLLICLFGSRSKSGMLAAAVSLLLMLFLFRRHIGRHRNAFLLSAALLAAAFFAINFTGNNALLSGIYNIFHQGASEAPSLTAIGTDKDAVSVTWEGNTMYIHFSITSDGEDFDVEIRDEAGRPVPFHFTDDTQSTLTSNDTRFPFTIYGSAFEDGRLGFTLEIGGRSWEFTNQTEDGTFYCYAPSGVLTKISQPEAAFFRGHESFASGRGFIWSRTIPLLKKTLLLGTGPATFYLVYPNDELVGMSNYGYAHTFVTKPHSLYLQIGVQTGVLSLLAFLAFYFFYFIQSIRLYRKHLFDSFLSKTGAAILSGTAAYMTAALANDSTVAVAPVFWGLIGIGLAVNRLVKNSMAPEM